MPSDSQKLCFVIVADLTEWNPNVFYEMGVAHTRSFFPDVYPERKHTSTN
jgi:hypothetical protein